MKKFFFLFFGLLISFCSSLMFAQSLELTTFSPEISVGKPFTIQIKGTQLDSLESIQISGMEQLQLLGQQVATSVQIINGQQESQQIISLQVQASKEGSLTIGPASIKHGTGTISSEPLIIKVEASFQSLKEQLKGAQNIEKAIFPWKIIAIMIAGLLGLYSIRRRYGKKKEVKEQTTFIKEIHARPLPETGQINWLAKIPQEDDPLFAENSEHLIRNYLQHIWKTNVYHLTYQELLQLNSHQTGELKVSMESLRHALMLLQRARYAKLDLDKESLSEHMKKMFS